MKYNDGFIAYAWESRSWWGFAALCSLRWSAILGSLSSVLAMFAIDYFILSLFVIMYFAAIALVSAYACYLDGQ